VHNFIRGQLFLPQQGTLMNRRPGASPLQSVAAGVVLVGGVLRITLDIEAAHGDLPEA
jgi:hypothetical protein